MSAPRPGALASIFSLEPGTERQERRGRLRERSDMAREAKAPVASLQPCDVSRCGRSTTSLAASIGAAARRPARRRRGRAARTRSATGDGTRAVSSSTGGDLDFERAATTCARLRRTRLSGAGDRAHRARRRRPTTSLIGADCRARRRDRLTIAHVPRGARARRPRSAASDLPGRSRGSTTWSPASSTAASATASTSRCRRTPTRREHCSVACCGSPTRPTTSTCRPTTSCTSTSRTRNMLSVDGDGDHGRHRLGGHDDGRRGLRSRHARVLHATSRSRATRCSTRPRDRTDPRALAAVRRAHGAASGRLVAPRTTDDFDDPVVRSISGPPCWPRSALGRVGVDDRAPGAHAARARRRRVRLVAAGRRVRREQRGRGRRRRRHHRDRHADGARRSGSRSRPRSTGSAARCAGILLTHAHIDHVGGTRGFPNAGVYGSPQTSQLLDGAMPVDAYKAFMPAFDAEFDELAELGTRPGHAPRHRRRVPHAAHRGDAGRRATPPATSSRSSPTPTCLFAGDLCFFGVTPLAFQGDPALWAEMLDDAPRARVDHRSRARAGRRRRGGARAAGLPAALRRRARSRPARGTPGRNATRATRSTSSAPQLLAAGRDEMPPAMLSALGFG